MFVIDLPQWLIYFTVFCGDVFILSIGCFVLTLVSYAGYEFIYRTLKGKSNV